MELTELTENNIDCTDVSDKYYNIRLFRVQFHTNLEAEVVIISGRKFIAYVDKDPSYHMIIAMNTLFEQEAKRTKQ